jgi:hypothetical protein
LLLHTQQHIDTHVKTQGPRIVVHLTHHTEAHTHTIFKKIKKHCTNQSSNNEPGHVCVYMASYVKD